MILSTRTLMRLCTLILSWSAGEFVLNPYGSGPDTDLNGGGPAKLWSLEKAPRSGLAVHATYSPPKRITLNLGARDVVREVTLW